MQLSQSLLFEKYTYSFFIIGLQFILLFNQLAGRLDIAKSSFYDSTMPVTGVDYPQWAIISDRPLLTFSQFSPVDMPLIQG